MSADNWTICPHCNPAKKRADRLAEVRAQYGKVSQEEYETMLADVQLKSSAETQQPDETLREDWDIGVYQDTKDGKFYFSVNYGGGCEKCGFHLEFKHKEELKYDITTPKKNEGSPGADHKNHGRQNSRKRVG